MVKASTPQSEWAETAAKLVTMLNAFGLYGGALKGRLSTHLQEIALMIMNDLSVNVLIAVRP